MYLIQHKLNNQKEIQISETHYNTVNSFYPLPVCQLFTLYQNNSTQIQSGIDTYITGQYLLDRSQQQDTTMSEIYASEHQKQHQFFMTLKRYAERINQEKNLSLTYLQTINKLSAQVNQKDALIQNLLKQNQQLKEKLTLYEQVMARSRIMIKSNHKSLQNHNAIAAEPNAKRHLMFSPKNSYANMKFSRFIQNQKFTESIVQTRNQLDYLKEYDHEAYEKLTRKITSQSQLASYHQPYKENGLDSVKEKLFPIFEDFIILKPTQNANISPENINQLKIIFSLSPKNQIKKGNKVFESVSTYLCHNTGPQWLPQEYKTQITTGKTNTGMTSNVSIVNMNDVGSPLLHNNTNSSSEIIIYLSNSEETLKPITQTSDSQIKISSVYLEFNPSLYFYGFCFKSHSLQYVNGKLQKIPLLYTFVTRYPFLSYWRQLLQLIVERLNLKNQMDLAIFKKQLQVLKEKSIDEKQGIINLHQQMDTRKNFQFQLLQKQITWKKIHRSSNFKISQPYVFQQTNQIIKISTQQPKQRHFLTKNQCFNSSIAQVILNEIVPAFSCYNIELIIDVLLLLLLEIPIAIVSKSEAFLQKFMLYFVYIIKPLKYPFPIIFNLPLNMSVVLQSPFPSFLGVTDHHIIEPYMFERTVFDLDEKVAKSWPNIDFYNQSRECVIRWINNKLQYEQSQVSKLEKMNQLVQVLISSSKNYPEDLKELRTYRKYFKKTEIWHIYCHSNEDNFGKN